MSKKVKEKITMDIDGKIVELNKAEACAVQRAMKRSEKEAELAAMTDDEKKALRKKRTLKIAGIGAGAVAILGGVLMAAGGKGKAEEGETVLLEEHPDDELDELVAMEETADETSEEV